MSIRDVFRKDLVLLGTVFYIGKFFDVYIKPSGDYARRWVYFVPQSVPQSSSVSLYRISICFYRVLCDILGCDPFI